jgi:hypothetical protein
MSPFFSRYFLPKPATPVEQPIIPPSNPSQYRAIGLVRGKYHASPEKINRGLITDAQGNIIRAVVLEKVISLIRKHLDLSKEHLWVVYPRTDLNTGELHLQIVGIWEPETLAQNKPSSIVANSPDKYFSIRGEVIKCDRRQQSVIVKIKQKPKKQGEKPLFFKLKLQGTLANPQQHFWDLEAYLDTDKLVIQKATNLGLLPQYKKTKPLLKIDLKDTPTKSLDPSRSPKISPRDT